MFQLPIIISTGKSFLIKALQQLLGDRLLTAAFTGVAANLVSGQTINSLFRINIQGEFIDLSGDSLRTLQDSMENVGYIILEEMSTIDQGLFGKIDRRLRQAFPHQSDQFFGGRSVILLGDFAQIPPVAGTPLYSGKLSSNQWKSLGRLAYGSFNNAVVLDKVCYST